MLLIAEVVPQWDAFSLRKGVLQAEVLVQISLDRREAECYNLKQICSISGAINKCIGACVHL